MPQNPHVRTIRLLNPAEDLAVDDADPRRARTRRPPVNPADGLLDDDSDSDAPSAGIGSAPAQNSRSAPAAPEKSTTAEKPAPARAASDDAKPAAATGAAAPASPVASEKFESSGLGEVPDSIEGDFPDPVDL